MTLMTLVYGGGPRDRERAIAATVPPIGAGVIIEGLPDGTGVLEELAASSQLQLQRIAPGCPCCQGNLTVRVMLNRMLRLKPAQIYLGIAEASHLPSIREFLQEDQYRERLLLGPEINCGP
jgi:hypothetical protein